VHLLGGQQETTEHLLAVFGVAAARETAQVFEPAFAQIGGAQPMSSSRRESKQSQHVWQLGLKLSDHLWRGPPPASTESPRPVPRMRFVLRLCLPWWELRSVVSAGLGRVGPCRSAD